MIRKILTSVMFLVISVSAFAADIPELTTRSTFMGEVQPTAEQKESLDSTLKALEDNSKIHMAVLVVDSIKPSSIEEFSMKVAEKWKLGMKGVDNGALLIVATKDRKARIEVGKGLEGTLTDAMTRRIQKEEMIPFFKKGDFVSGIIAAVEGVRDATKTEVPVLTHAIEQQKVANSESSDIGFGLFLVLIIGVPASIMIYLVFFKTKPATYQKTSLADYEAMLDKYPPKPAPRMAPIPPRPPAPSRAPAAPYSSPSPSASRRSSSSSSSSSSSRSSRSDDDSYSRSSGYSGYSSSSIYDSGSSSSSSSSSSSDSSSSSSSTSSGGGDFSGGGSSSDW